MAPEIASRSFSHLKRRKSLVEEVTEELAQRIANGDFAPGDRLPTGAELTEAFGVSLAVVREAMSKLKHDGLIETQQGSGAFVTQPGRMKTFRLDADDPRLTLKNIYELRQPLEGKAAALAALRRSDDDILELKMRLDLMAEKSVDEMTRVAADQAFHEKIVDVTRNKLYRDLFAFLFSQISVSIDSARSNSLRHAGFSQQAQDEHELILSAIIRGDAHAAEAAAVDHVRSAAARLGFVLD